MGMIDSTDIQSCAKMMDVLAQRHRVIANNIANVQTPGYRTRDIVFKDVLEKVESLKEGSTSPADFLSSASEVEVNEVLENPADFNPGQNDVDMDREMVKLAANTILYKAYTQLMIMNLKQINQAIK